MGEDELGPRLAAAGPRGLLRRADRERRPGRAETFRAAVAALAPDSPVARLCDGGGGCRADAGGTPRGRRADLLVNISGHLDLEPIKAAPAARLRRRRPGLHADLGTPRTAAPARSRRTTPSSRSARTSVRPAARSRPADIEWRPTAASRCRSRIGRRSRRPSSGRFTTVATWRGPFGTLVHGGTDSTASTTSSGKCDRPAATRAATSRWRWTSTRRTRATGRPWRRTAGSWPTRGRSPATPRPSATTSAARAAEFSVAHRGLRRDRAAAGSATARVRYLAAAGRRWCRTPASAGATRSAKGC